MVAPAPYWGNLPASVSRENSVHRDGKRKPMPLNTKADRHDSAQSQARQNRTSIQTEASTLSPFVSPVGSTFVGDGLTPRPPTVPYPAGSAYENDRPVENQSRRTIQERSHSKPALDVLTAPSDKHARKLPKEISDVVEPQYSYPPSKDFTSKRRDSTDFSVDKFSAHKQGSERRAVSESQAGKGSSFDSAGVKRRPGLLADRSPLQQLELDVALKKEKRAKVEAAERLAKELAEKTVTARANGTQNSVRFRNRPVAKSDSQGVLQPNIEDRSRAPTVQDQGAKPLSGVKDNGAECQADTEAASPTMSGGQNSGQDLQQEKANEKREAVATAARATGDEKTAATKIGAAAVASTAFHRSSSKKLKKEPPGDPWYNRRADAERQYPAVMTSRRAPAYDYRAPVVSPVANLPAPVGNTLLQYSMNDTDSDSPHDSAADPSRSHSVRKVELLTGGKPTPKELKLTRPICDVSDPSESQGNFAVQSANNHHAEVFHNRHDNRDGVYTPGPRLDEWKQGGIALLHGALLDLENDGHSESEKDKAWWEAGNPGKRRSSLSKSRGAAYNGEYEDDKGTESPISNSVMDCAACETRRNASTKKVSWKAPRSSHSSYRVSGDTKNIAPSQRAVSSSEHIVSTLSSSEFSNIQAHSLTCSLRSIRVRPKTAPTRFKPPLLLKCGPLLRYCGLRNEKRRGNSTRSNPEPFREIWRGSVMIVTEDEHSSYELAPILRLFLQPTDLLPPPPAQVNEGLAPEYVDPIAGLPKIGKDGRTLYIRPVEVLEQRKDLSEYEAGLFEPYKPTLIDNDGAQETVNGGPKTRYDGEKVGKYREVRGFRLHTEQGVTFWRFNVEIELKPVQQRLAYRINRGPATNFWVPARDEAMNIMFHSCNGFSMSVDPNEFSGPDPLWRDVLNTHQTQPFHVMLGGGDQLYNDAVVENSPLFKDWTSIRNPHRKEKEPFSGEMQAEMESFYLNNYCKWFSRGLFSLAASQIPMINIYDDHDIIDGYGSYPHSHMSCPVMSGLGNVAFKYYMLFQHQSSIDEGEDTENSWILGTQPGPYINELSRSVFTFLGRSVAFLGVDCRTERMFDEIVSSETWEKMLDHVEGKIIKGQTKHLIVMLGVPVAYPRLVWLENLLTSRAMAPVKTLGKSGILGKKFLNHYDGGIEILDDLDDHWTAQHHKEERNWLIHELQHVAAEKSIRVTILGGDVHLGAVGQFYSSKASVSKDRDHRYMPNIISSAIVNEPAPDMLADFLNKRNKVHHLDHVTDESMIPIFNYDVDGKQRNNKCLLNRRNWCSIRQYNPNLSPPSTPEEHDEIPSPPLTRRGSLMRRFSSSRGPSFRPDVATPPVSSQGFFEKRRERRASTSSERPGSLTRTLSLSKKDFLRPSLFRRSSKRRPDAGGINGYGADSEEDFESERRDGEVRMRGGAGGSAYSYSTEQFTPSSPRPGSAQLVFAEEKVGASSSLPRPGYRRQPTGLSEKQRRNGAMEVNLEGGLEVTLNMEVQRGDPAGITQQYRLLIPRLWFDREDAGSEEVQEKKNLVAWVRRKGGHRRSESGEAYEERQE